MRGFQHVFTFTFIRQLKSNGYRVVTLLMAVLLFALPFFGLPALERSAGRNPTPETEWIEGDELHTAPENTGVIYLVNEAPGYTGDLTLLATAGIPGYGHAEMTACESYKAAADKAAVAGNSLIMILCEDGGCPIFRVAVPENSALNADDAALLTETLSIYGDALLLAGHGIDPQAGYAAVEIPEVVRTDSAEAANEEISEFREMLGMLLPYLNIMLIYFLVLYYGQGVAQSCIMEKSSKLMDTFLVSVEPRAMLTGKVLASASAAILQFGLWAAACMAGLKFGMAQAESIHTIPQSMVVSVLKMLAGLDAGFSTSAIPVSLLLIASGFLLYCSLASIGGALAGKQEELGSTNILFTGLLIFSFFVTLRTGLLDNVSAGAQWTDFFPFTAVLVTPARVLIGSVSVWQGLLSAAVMLVLALGVLIFAGQLYKMMSLYKGSVPKPAQLLRMLKENR